MGTVLVVDDDAVNATLVTEILLTANHTVFTSGSAEEALVAVQAVSVEVAVVDVMLPGKSGLDLVRKLRALPSLAHIRVLVLSALDRAPDRVAGLRSGADDYLAKPFEAEELLLRVERLLASERRPQRPLDCLPEAGGTRERLGRYEVGEMLGRGSMGAVFRGWDPLLKRSLAVKTILAEAVAQISPELDPLTTLIDEAVSTARVSHPHVVIVHDAGICGDSAFIAMELVEGASLASLVRRWRKLSPGPMMALAVAIARGLEAAHLQGIVHHDLKPENVLLGLDGAIKLTDFGLAAVLSALGRTSGKVFGTPGYLPPEVLRGTPMDQRGDLFALGVTLYRGLTGTEPFRGLSVEEVVANTLHRDPPRPSQLVPGIPQELEALVMELVSRDPGRRPGSAQVLARLDRQRPPSWDPSLLLRLDEGPVRVVTSERLSCALPVEGRGPAGSLRGAHSRPAP